jgi:hypothetical protein
MEAIVVIVLLFVVLVALKLAALAGVSYFGPIVALPVIAACYLIARRIDPPTAAKPE